MRILNWKSLFAFSALLVGLLAPRFGHAGDPESKNSLLAAPQVPADSQPRLSILLAHEEGAAEWVSRLAARLERREVVDIVPQSGADAASYVVELGLREDRGRQLRIRVLSSRDDQVLLAFRESLDDRDRALEGSADRLAKWFAGREWTSSVESLDGDRVTIYGGSKHLLEAGFELRAVADQPVYDDAGHELGRASTAIGRLRLIEVGERMAVAEIVDGCELLGEGTEVVLIRR